MQIKQHVFVRCSMQKVSNTALSGRKLHSFARRNITVDKNTAILDEVLRE